MDTTSSTSSANNTNCMGRYLCCFKSKPPDSSSNSGSHVNMTSITNATSENALIGEEVESPIFSCPEEPQEYWDRDTMMSSTDSYDHTTLEELQTTQPKIDSKLEDKIKQMESVYKTYEEMENCSLEKVGPSLVKTLLQLRENPDAFLVSTDPSIRELARQRSVMSVSGHNSLPRLNSTSSGDGHLSASRRQSLTLSSRSNPLRLNSVKTNRRSSWNESRSLSSPVMRHGIPSLNRDEIGDILVTNSREAASLFEKEKKNSSKGGEGIQQQQQSQRGRRLHTKDQCKEASDENSSLSDGEDEDEEDVESVRLGRGVSTQQLSAKWAGRLAEVTPTQGKFSRQVNEKGDLLGLRVRPRWPEWLSDALYDVIKVNRYGKRQRRTIKLTEYHMINIKGGDTATRIIPYKCITRAALSSPKAFIVEFVDASNEDLDDSHGSSEGELSGGGGSMRYESLLAGHIVQQLTTRAQVRQGLDKIGGGLGAGKSSSSNRSIGESSSSSSSSNTTRVGYSVNATAAMIEAIGEENAKDHSDIAQFARYLGRRARERLTSVGTLSEGSSAMGEDLDLPEELEKQGGKLTRLISVESGSGEGEVKKAIQKVILDQATPEGNTARHFIANFPDRPEEGNLTELRHFVDGMYEYIVENRGAELSMLLTSDESFRMSDMSTAEVGGGESPSSSAPMGMDFDEDVMTTISYLAYSVVEEAMFLSLQDKVTAAFVPSGSPSLSEDTLRRKMKHLSSRTQSDWGITDDHASPSDWRLATFELAGVERNPTPSLRLNALVRAAKAIYSEHKRVVLPVLKERKGYLSDSDMVLGGDDILPIFIYVICRSDLEHPALNKDILWKLCHPDQLHGESGYYLTLYESALEYISSLEVDEMDLNSVTLDTKETFRSGSIGGGELGVKNFVKGRIRRLSTAVTGGQFSPSPRTSKAKSFVAG